MSKNLIIEDYLKRAHIITLCKQIVRLDKMLSFFSSITLPFSLAKTHLKFNWSVVKIMNTLSASCTVATAIADMLMPFSEAQS